MIGEVNFMDNELNLRLLGMMRQISYLMQTKEKCRGQGRLLILLRLYGTSDDAQRAAGWYGEIRIDLSA